MKQLLIPRALRAMVSTVPRPLVIVLFSSLGLCVCSHLSAPDIDVDAAPTIPQKRMGDASVTPRSPDRPTLPALQRPDSSASSVSRPSPPNGPPPEIARPYDPSSNAQDDIAAALQLARQSKTRVLLVFGGNWCPWCRRLAHTFHNDPAISRELAQNFQVVRVDATGEHNDGLVKRYGSPTKHGVPVIVVLDPDGEMVTTQETGSLERGDRHDPAKVLAFLKRVRL